MFWDECYLGLNKYINAWRTMQYSKTNNYHELLEFINLGVFQVDIIGHGCGLTDRVLLNHLFEHVNCDSVKIFHYKGIEGFNETYMHLSRHFRDKQKLRERVLPFDPKVSCPQKSS